MRRTLPPSVRIWLALSIVGLVLAGCRSTREPEPPPTSAERTPDSQPGASLPPSPTQEPASGLVLAIDPVLEQVVRATLGEEIDHYGVVVKDLDRGTGIAINPDHIFYAASLLKLPVMYEAFRQRETGRLSFDRLLTVTAADAAEDLGTLDLFEIAVGDRLPVGELLSLMITASDNTASVMLRSMLGRQAIDQSVRDLGLRATSVESANLPTTAADMTVLLEAMATGQAVSETASEEMAQLLLGQRVRDRIPAGLPPDVPVGNKTGNWSSATHDVAIVYAPTGTYLLSVLSDLPDDGGMIAGVSRQVYAYYSGGPR
ncbi:MAG: serine hydrolase [Dehalococcoidia bacterium]